MMKRNLLISLALMVTLLLAGVVNGQDMCYQLSADDCQAINDAYAGLEGVNSFAMDYSIDLNISGLPEDAGFSAMTFSNAGTGTFAMDMEAAFPIQMDLTMTTNATGPEPVENSVIPIRIVDGFLYMDVGDGWRGVNLVEAMSNPDALGLPFDPNALASGDMSGLEEAGMDPNMMMGMMGSVMALSEVDGFLTYARNGNTFTFTADAGVLISDPAFTEVLTAMGETDPDLAQAAAMAPFLTMLLDNGTIVINQGIGEGGFVDTIDFLVDFTIDMSALDPSMAEPIVFDLDFTVQISDPNGMFEFVAPADAIIEPLN